MLPLLIIACGSCWELIALLIFALGVDVSRAGVAGAHPARGVHPSDTVAARNAARQSTAWWPIQHKACPHLSLFWFSLTINTIPFPKCSGPLWPFLNSKNYIALKHDVTEVGFLYIKIDSCNFYFHQVILSCIYTGCLI